MLNKIMMMFVIIGFMVGCTNRPNDTSPMVISGKIVAVEYLEKRCKIVLLTVLLQDSSSATRSIFAGVKVEETYDLAVKMINKPVMIKANLDNSPNPVLNCAQEVTSISLNENVMVSK